MNTNEWMLKNSIKLSLLLSLLLTVGCSERSESYASGKVLLDGNPVGPGRVTFVPPDNPKAPSFGPLDTRGNYSISTNKVLGLTAGTYKVSIVAYEVPTTDPNVRQTEPEKSLVPSKYNYIETSGLEVEVAKGNNDIDLELSSE